MRLLSGGLSLGLLSSRSSSLRLLGSRLHSSSSLLCTDGLEISYIYQPSATPSTSQCLLLHGWLDNSGSFTPFMNLVKEDKENHKNMWALDLPGHGRSDHKSFDSPHVITDYVFYVKSMVDHIMKETGVSSVSLVGHSMGSSVGCLFASVYPEMVEDLVMIEGLGPMSSPSSSITTQIRSNVNKRQTSNPTLSASKTRYYPNLESAVSARVESALKAPGNQYISPSSARCIVSRALRTREDGCAYFVHDKRLSWPSLSYLTEGQVEAVLGAVECKVLVVKADDGWPGKGEGFEEGRLRCFRDGLVRVERVGRGSHHCHMDEGSRGEVKEIIVDFWKEGEGGRNRV